MDGQVVWVDTARCAGCGACVGVCPVEAIVLADGKAHVDEETCTGCEACLGVCPEGAIQPLIRGELVPVPERPPPAVRQPSPLAETAGVVAVATGVSLLARATRALGRAVARWLMRPQIRAKPSVTETPSETLGRGAGGQGRRARRRRRGRRGE
jgi:NAD-dependent dihydropyrimidine dehydrogenase PreA subunit